MADNAQLDTFLAGTPPDGAEAPDPLIDPQGWAKTQKSPEAPPEPPTKASEKSGELKPEAEPQEEDVAPHSGSDNRTVPFSALEKVRNDWKSKYAAEQARAELLAKQLEEAKRPPPQQAAPQPVYRQPPPDPAADPYGYANYAWQKQMEAQLNHQLNVSEMLLREKVGDDKVTEYVNEFKELAARDQSLFPKLYSQPHPFAWLQKEVERQRVLRDVGDDPTAYEQKLRAKWEAEKAEQPMNGGNGHAVSPAAGLAPSLANVRSVAGRTTTTFTGPPPLEALFPGHNRRDQRRQ